jgi:hypothetical protein
VWEEEEEEDEGGKKKKKKKTVLKSIKFSAFLKNNPFKAQW